ncbi:hypothetical protein Mapa_011000 [Marchantia paleacea]|nr:hypothetical protein Mapa_011000 [Marchantia paleacea]
MSFSTELSRHIRIISMSSTRYQTNRDVRIPKLHSCFLCEGDVPLGPLWTKILEGNEDRYNTYVHVDPFRASSLEGPFWDEPTRVGQRNLPPLVQ